MHHHDGGKAGGLGAQTARPQADGDETGGYGLTDLANGEVALGTYQDQGVGTGGVAPQRVEQTDPRHLVVAMGDVAAASRVTRHEGGERRHALHLGDPRLAALLDGGDDDGLHSRQLDLATLGELAVEEGQRVEAYLDGLLDGPLRTVHQLRGRHGQVKTALPRTGLRKGLDDVVQAVVVGHQRETGSVEGAAAVHQHHLVALTETKHTAGVLGLVLRELVAKGRLGDVEIADFLHSGYRGGITP